MFNNKNIKSKSKIWQNKTKEWDGEGLGTKNAFFCRFFELNKLVSCHIEPNDFLASGITNLFKFWVLVQILNLRKLLRSLDCVGDGQVLESICHRLYTLQLKTYGLIHFDEWFIYLNDQTRIIFASHCSSLRWIIY